MGLKPVIYWIIKSTIYSNNPIVVLSNALLDFTTISHVNSPKKITRQCRPSLFCTSDLDLLEYYIALHFQIGFSHKSQTQPISASVETFYSRDDDDESKVVKNLHCGVLCI